MVRTGALVDPTIAAVVPLRWPGTFMAPDCTRQRRWIFEEKERVDTSCCLQGSGHLRYGSPGHRRGGGLTPTRMLEILTMLDMTARGLGRHTGYSYGAVQGWIKGLSPMPAPIARGWRTSPATGRATRRRSEVRQPMGSLCGRSLKTRRPAASVTWISGPSSERHLYPWWADHVPSALGLQAL
jgi:hypothetical protein